MNPQNEQSTGALVEDALSQASALVRHEVDLARAEIVENAERAGAAVGMTIAAVIFAITALNVLTAAVVVALSELGVHPGLSALLVGLSFAGLAYFMASKGGKDLKLSALAPTRTAKNIKRDAQAVKESL